jgi:hypothetical protein
MSIQASERLGGRRLYVTTVSKEYEEYKEFKERSQEAPPVERASLARPW